LLRARSREQLVDAELLPEQLSDALLDLPMLARERHTAVVRALENLPRNQRVLLKVTTADPAPSYEEISLALQMPVGSIGPTRCRALARLRADRRLREAIED
jgi:DNA-directed RNA polymerase specialized sigma24 family protein